MVVYEMRPRVERDEALCVGWVVVYEDDIKIWEVSDFIA